MPCIWPSRLEDDRDAGTSCPGNETFATVVVLRAIDTNEMLSEGRYLTHEGWWPQLALASAAISLAMIALWWGGLVVGSALFALVFDLAVIAVVLWQLRSGAVIS